MNFIVDGKKNSEILIKVVLIHEFVSVSSFSLFLQLFATKLHNQLLLRHEHLHQRAYCSRTKFIMNIFTENLDKMNNCIL